jgi:hypothetical protein
MTALNTDVVAALAAGGYPALSDGAILFGPASVYQHSRPPRIIVTPKGGAFSAPDLYSRGNAAEKREQIGTPVVHSERVTFEVRCWGGVDAASQITDYDLTRALDKEGEFTDGSTIGALGVEFVFSTWLDMPVLDSLAPYDAASRYAPAGVLPVTTDTMTAPTGETGSGC